MLTSRRNTKQRDIIHHIVIHSHSHPTADEVYAEAKKLVPSVSLGTVYRNLNLLTSEGKIKEVNFEGSASRFDGMLAEHEHFICSKCCKVIDIERDFTTTNVIEGSKEVLPGGTVTGYSLTYYGLCPNCR